MMGTTAAAAALGCAGVIYFTLSDMIQFRQFNRSETTTAQTEEALTVAPPEESEPVETTLPPEESSAETIPAEITEEQTAVPEETTKVEETTAEKIPVVVPFEITNAELKTMFEQIYGVENDYAGTVIPEGEDAGQEYLDRIVFLGDSITYGLKRYSMLSGGYNTKQIWTPKIGTLTLAYVMSASIYYPEYGKEISIQEAVAAKKPDIMVITLGMNGVSFMKEAYFKSVYTQLVEMIQETSPETKIILQSIMPVARSYEKQISINNKKIAQANVWIAQVAKDCGVYYVNTITSLLAEDGYMPEAYQNGDGMHFNKDGYTLMLDYLRRHSYPESSAEDMPEDIPPEAVSSAEETTLPEESTAEQGTEALTESEMMTDEL